MAIFINYRRADSQSITGRIDDHLRITFGEHDVYRDIDSIPPGEDFVEHIRSALQQCDLCIAVLGPRWISERLMEENDFVRLELEAILDRGIPIIPVLVEDARLPCRAEVPDSLASLLRRQAVRIDSGADFRGHIRRLTEAIRAIRERRASLDDAMSSLKRDELSAALLADAIGQQSTFSRDRTRDAGGDLADNDVVPGNRLQSISQTSAAAVTRHIDRETIGLLLFILVPLLIVVVGLWSRF